MALPWCSVGSASGAPARRYGSEHRFVVRLVRLLPGFNHLERGYVVGEGEEAQPEHLADRPDAQVLTVVANVLGDDDGAVVLSVKLERARDDVRVRCELLVAEHKPGGPVQNLANRFVLRFPGNPQPVLHTGDPDA